MISVQVKKIVIQICRQTVYFSAQNTAKRLSFVNQFAVIFRCGPKRLACAAHKVYDHPIKICPCDLQHLVTLQ